MIRNRSRNICCIPLMMASYYVNANELDIPFVRALDNAASTAEHITPPLPADASVGLPETITRPLPVMPLDISASTADSMIGQPVVIPAQITLNPGDSLADVLTKAGARNGITVLWQSEPINVSFAVNYTEQDFLVNINDLFRDMLKSQGARFDVVLYKNNVLVVSSEEI